MGDGWECVDPPDILAAVERVTGNGSARQAADTAMGRVAQDLGEHAKGLRRRLRLPGA
jgi:hypothetical protein